MSTPLTVFTMPTFAGPAHAVVTPEDGVLRLFGWLDSGPNIERLPADLRARGVSPGAGPADIRNAVEAYCDGDFQSMDGLAVEQPGTPFLRTTWDALRAVTPGRPITYSELAASAGRPSAVRAAASACARNLIALVVPCHRIVRSDGTLGQYFYGVGIKRSLLAHEQRFTLGQ